MSIVSKVKSAFEKPMLVFTWLSVHGFLNWMPDKMYLKTAYRISLHKKLNLKTPKTYNEKLQWLKLYDRKPEYTEMVDKFEVRKYIAEKIGEEYLIPLVGGPWESFDEIDFEKLPEQFVLKTTHDSGGVVICTDKNKFDKEKAKEKLTKSMNYCYYWRGREWPYKNAKPKIIAEQYIEDEVTSELRDYKFFAFDGDVKCLFIASDRQNPNEETKFDFFDMDFKHLDFENGHPYSKIYPNKPQEFEKMKELASKLSKGIPQLRVDLYEVNGKIYFGELTFFHWSGFVPFNPEEWDETFGSWLKLPDKNK